MTKKAAKKSKALNPAAGRDALGPGFEAGRGAGGEQEPENDDAPERADKIHDVADAGDGDGFGELGGRKSVGVRRAGGRR